MKSYNIDKLKPEQTEDRLYDLTTPTFIMYKGSLVYSYLTTEGDEMRPDLLCHNIYGNTDNIDFLLNLNGIINPLNIISDQIIIYVEDQDIQNFRPPEEEIDNIKATFLNLSKKKSKDINREKRKDDKTPLPPTVNQRKVDPVTLQGNKVTIGKGLFNV